MKYKSTGHAIFHCVLTDCYFKIDVPLALGKKAVCWRCAKDFVMNEYSLRLARPHCHNCTKTKNEVPDVTDKVVEVAADTSMNSLRDRLRGLAAVEDKGEI